MLENEHVKMSWDLEYNMRKDSTARRPDVTIKVQEEKGNTSGRYGLPK